MPLAVTDSRSNSNDNIAYAAKAIGRSKQRAQVFVAIHQGRKRIKTVTEIAKIAHLSRKRALEEAVKLYNKKIVARTTRDGEIAYERDDFLSAHRKEVLKLAGNQQKLSAYPTKYSRPAAVGTTILSLPKSHVQVKCLSVDDIDTFSAVRRIKPPLKRLALSERAFKNGIRNLLGERAVFKDWGGEQFDFFSDNLRLTVGRKRLQTAFALKGPGTKGRLTMKKMGKNGDQILRLFVAAAELFVVQYWGDIDPSVNSLMAELAKAKSASNGGSLIRYAVIDGQDSDRLALAYPKAFGLSGK